MYPLMGPISLSDITGHAVAVQALLASCEVGTYHKDHVQYETIRRYQSAFANLLHASARGAGCQVSAESNHQGPSMVLTTCPTESDWYKRFDKGLKIRMGQDVRPQLGFSIQIMLVMMKRLEALWNEMTPTEEKDDVLGAMVYAGIAYANALRGNKRLKTDLGRLRKHMQRSKNHTTNPHCVAPILGRFKGEDGERYHLLLMASVTASGLEPRRLIEMLVIRREEQGFLNGPAFIDGKGEEVSSGQYEMIILRVLHDQQQWENELPSESEKILEGVDIDEVYGISGSFKRGVITRAQDAGAKQSEVEFMGCWRTVEQAAGQKPSRLICEHYTELTQMLGSRLSFSKAL